MKISPARVWREKEVRYRLVGSRCRKCGKAVYPPKPVCPFCGSNDVEKVELPKRGRVVSWTVEYVVPAGYRVSAPIVVALVELDNGVKVLAPLTDVKPEEVYPNMEVEATLRKIYEDGDEGVIVYGIKFVPIRRVS